MQIDRLDHLVLTVTDLDQTCQFYTQVMGMQVVNFGNGRQALAFGQQKINLHPVGSTYEPKASRPLPGSADLCFITDLSLPLVIAHLNRHRITIEQGPVGRTGALGPMQSVYIRDPDQNLIEISHYGDRGT
jgi:catechol 2,3-dioxygenase-like lactoylglutathione lyase family enzyme